MEQTLGNITHYKNLRREEGVGPGGPPRWLPIDFRAGRLPWTITGSALARRAIGSVIDRVDGLFVHTTTIALLAADHFGRKPTVLSSDGTPFSKRRMRADYGLRPQTGLAEQAKRALHRAVFRRARGFVGWSNWTKQSFVEDYGCREEDVAVIPPGIDLSQFSRGDRSHELPRILFVGADFSRKGGDLLLDVFRRRLRGRAELVVVTKAEVPEEPFVHVHRDVVPNSPKLRELFATSDLFALPTRADCFPLACMEALATELPIVATRAGGIPELVREGETGHLFEPGDADALGDALEALITDPRRRETMGRAAREDAACRFEVRTNARRLFEFVRGRCS